MPATTETLGIPPGGVARIHHASPVPGAPPAWLVIIATAQQAPCPAAMTEPGSISALLRHAPGVTWPNREGEALASGMLAGGGIVALAFHALADAMAAHRRLTRGGGR